MLRICMWQHHRGSLCADGVWWFTPEATSCFSVCCTLGVICEDWRGIKHSVKLLVFYAVCKIDHFHHNVANVSAHIYEIFHIPK